MKFRIRYADQVVGTFVILSFFILVGFLVAVGSRQRWFAKDARYESRFSSAPA
jgi:phospholipid/cholesterol/gamma-HCH transport system substrate-binding protein